MGMLIKLLGYVSQDEQLSSSALFFEAAAELESGQAEEDTCQIKSACQIFITS
jgi:hypothetical protein